MQSPDYQTIYSAVIDTYTSNVTLKPWAEDEHMLQTAHIINIVNVFDKSWSTAQVLLTNLFCVNNIVCYMVRFTGCYPIRSSMRMARRALTRRDT